MFETDALFESAVFGKVVENFLGSEIGDYLLAKAKTEEQEAIHQLAKVAPWRRRRIQDLQNQIWRAQQFQIWLADAIADGQQATRLLEGEE
jgi:uncharacterized protein YaaN involved in tellurite resistance